MKEYFQNNNFSDNIAETRAHEPLVGLGRLSLGSDIADFSEDMVEYFSKFEKFREVPNIFPYLER